MLHISGLIITVLKRIKICVYFHTVKLQSLLYIIIIIIQKMFHNSARKNVSEKRNRNYLEMPTRCGLSDVNMFKIIYFDL